MQSILAEIHIFFTYCFVLQLSFAIPLLEKLQQKIGKLCHGRPPKVQHDLALSVCIMLYITHQ